MSDKSDVAHLQVANENLLHAMDIIISRLVELEKSAQNLLSILKENNPFLLDDAISDLEKKLGLDPNINELGFPECGRGPA